MLYVECLIPIWERVLNRSPIFSNDNFFELGGNFALAIKLIIEIEDALGRELPITALHEAPTIAQLASSLAHSPSLGLAPFIKLKAGKNSTPVFIAQGLGGGLQALFDLAGQIRPDNPIYAIDAKGLNRPNIPYGRIEDLAEYYFHRVTQQQSHGPYILVGYSFGGLIFLELACRLHERGEKIGLFVLLDTYPSPRFWSLRSRFNVFARRVSHHFLTASKIPVDEAIPYLRRRLQRLLGGQSPSGMFLPKLMQQAIKTETQGWQVVLARYQPRTYPGKITFFKCASHSIFPSDPTMIWGKFVNEIDIRAIPGEHTEILTNNIDAVAVQLSLCLQDYNRSAA